MKIEGHVTCSPRPCKDMVIGYVILASEGADPPHLPRGALLSGAPLRKIQMHAYHALMDIRYVASKTSIDWGPSGPAISRDMG